MNVTLGIQPNAHLNDRPYWINPVATHRFQVQTTSSPEQITRLIDANLMNDLTRSDWKRSYGRFDHKRSILYGYRTYGPDPPPLHVNFERAGSSTIVHGTLDLTNDRQLSQPPVVASFAIALIVVVLVDATILARLTYVGVIVVIFAVMHLAQQARRAAILRRYRLFIESLDARS